MLELKVISLEIEQSASQTVLQGMRMKIRLSANASIPGRIKANGGGAGEREKE
jgi:hypothetical protein